MILDDIDIRRLRYFLVVADEKHFTRAADRIGIRQPPLSMQIRQLEETVGARLFTRHAKGVELTAAGRVFQDTALDIVGRFEDAVTQVRRHAAGQTGRLRLGFAGATYFHPAIPLIIRAYRSAYPDVVLSPEQSNTPALLAGLREGRLDVAFIRPPVLEDGLLSVRACLDEDMVVALPADHPLCDHDKLPLDAVAGENLILFPRDIGPGLYDSIVSACNEAGVSPKLGQEASQIVSIIPLVAAGFGVSIVPRSVASIRNEGAVYRPIAGKSPRAPIAIATRTDDHAKLVTSFVTSAVQIARSNTHADFAPALR
ncbi:LysR family transcriptional regulator [Agrobacterium larrymoorei]|uniref:DNA-binding transcriptional LysR family regulator n=1 Tax=Agrobacterium larrymoorei TaxID=160699 RepID=A0ABU0UMD3_9HYPH|nr:LysR family transcriptional regulator [Agrobacterium larrymoorei]MDQ1186109.1 DNA-binding transcriptional LysR family regulator [Agrobacterium larrymoorei]